MDALPPYIPEGKNSRTYVCYCEDVSSHDIEQAIDEGFADVQTLKRYSTVTMGPCQGKMCGRALAGICAAHAGSQQEGATADTYTTSRHRTSLCPCLYWPGGNGCP